VIVEEASWISGDVSGSSGWVPVVGAALALKTLVSMAMERALLVAWSDGINGAERSLTVL
jgi:hypothetical protein